MLQLVCVCVRDLLVIDSHEAVDFNKVNMLQCCSLRKYFLDQQRPASEIRSLYIDKTCIVFLRLRLPVSIAPAYVAKE